MKKIISYLFCLTMAVSCGFLKEEMVTGVSEDAAFSDEASLEAGIYGCLSALSGDAMITGNMNEFLNDCSGLINWCSTNRLKDANERWICALNFTQYSLNNYNYNEFCGFYKCIDRCNRMLSGLENSPVDSEYKTKIAAEAKLYRALSYLYLVRQWGDVPLRLQPTGGLDDANAPRTPFWEVYAQIIKDLEDAFKDMRTDDEVAAMFGRSAGRPCNYAAEALLSQVYLTLGTLMAHPDDNFWDTTKRTPDWELCGLSKAEDAFRKALTLAEDVIGNGPYVLANKYQELFSWTEPGDWELRERIFVITNGPEVNTFNYTAIRTLPQFPEGTINKSVKNNNYGRWRPSRYVFQRWCETYGGEKGSGAAANIFVSCKDPRFDQTIWHTSRVQLDNNSTISLYPSADRTFYDVTSQGRSCEPFFKKYLDPRYDANTGHADFYLMRFAEIYLIAAEASANLSSGTGDEAWKKAMDYVEVIHARARRSVADGLPEAAYPKWEAGRFADKDALITGIFWERIYELYSEGHEYWDTHRMGATWLAKNIAEPLNDFLSKPEQKHIKSNLSDDGSKSFNTILFGSQDFQYPTDPQTLRASLLCAFPANEIMHNSSISDADQNDFYIR